MPKVAVAARAASLKLNKLVEITCVGLLVLLVLDVWLGVLVRYAIPLPLTFTEELARYLMIWMALLAVSSGIAYREHIGVEFLFARFPAKGRRYLAVGFDLIAFAFFALLFWYGLEFVERGFKRQTMIFDMPKAYPFMGVPLAAALACIQLLLTAIHDFHASEAPERTGDALAGLNADALAPTEN
ncbi:TRAP transporter small permease [Limimaricola hongkongensis]|uniref:TRAP transporter small permease protein n=1 Tax=Limimaricola hongkongensis DSM 17492 TaxID=1122180 RepID=A0A017HFI5_9RHOB|nr:TRAP transporter small permease [Limimaricola hongkongensis]EYD73116.1 TRAP-type transport system, small permease component, predicted N-acetylneuraminate transporter [Limimaricola hongkongensis DSM 17492]